MNTGNGAEGAQEYLEECVTAFERTVEEFRTSHTTLSCTFGMNGVDRILLQFRMKGSTLQKPIKFPVPEKQAITPFVTGLMEAKDSLMVAEHHATDSIVTYYLKKKKKPASASGSPRRKADMTASRR